MSKKIRQKLHLFLWPLLIILIHLSLTITGGYYWWAHVDKIMHVLGGMSIALSGHAAITFYAASGKLKISNKAISAVILLSFVALAAVSWEFVEFILDHTTSTHMQPSLGDTMGDLFCGLVGGALVVATSLLRYKYRFPLSRE